jgi:hypothetical protein
MPYSATAAILMPVAKSLPPEAMDVFVKAANAAEDDGYDHNACIKAGWEDVRKGWERPSGSRHWVRKDDPGAGDVHVDAPLGAGKKPRKAELPDAEFMTTATVAKVDSALGLVFGYAIVCKIDGEDYFDVQGDNIPEDAMLKASTDFMLHSRVAKDMHAGDEVGPVVFAFPLTTDIAKSLGITAGKTGFLIGMKPGKDILAKYESGEYTGFSIGGHRIQDEVVE